MDYSALIDKIMPLVEDFSPLPFISSRNNGEWGIYYLDLSPEKAADAAHISSGGELHALLTFVEENIGEFSQEVTDHLTELDKPLFMLFRMDIPDLYSEFDDYDRDKTDEAIEATVTGKLKHTNSGK